MKRTVFFGLLVFVLVFGFIGCNDEDDSPYIYNDPYNPGNPGSPGTGGNSGLNGTWYSTGNVNKYVFSGNNYEHHSNGKPYRKGTYTTTSDSITMTITHIGGDYYASYTWLGSSPWYSKNEFKTAYQNYYREYYTQQLQSTKTSLQQIYNTYGSSTFYQIYGYSTPDAYINSLLDSYMVQIETTIDNSVNTLFPASNTVAFSLSGKTLYIGGVQLTKD